ncbi:hypothetical protein FOZ60_007383 [Perkinsus olseni]|uniref:Uncharacterized protein n=1 Tax=Perkinsus olseni TaxID=32597 RepID=A0A7J6NLZ7_PEROL|nr:hypothetical protein FOZ60_007383 [Perkinsus olseni]
MSQYIRFSSDDLKVFEAEILYRAKTIVSRSSSRDAVAARGQAFDDVASELRKANGDVFRTPKQVRTKWASTRQKIMAYYKTGKLPQSKCEAELVRNMAESLRSLLEQPQSISDSTSTTAASSSSATPSIIGGGGITSSTSTSHMRRTSACHGIGRPPPPATSSTSLPSITGGRYYSAAVGDTGVTAPPITLESSSPAACGSSMGEEDGIQLNDNGNNRRRRRQSREDDASPDEHFRDDDDVVLPAKVRKFITPTTDRVGGVEELGVTPATVVLVQAVTPPIIMAAATSHSSPTPPGLQQQQQQGDNDGGKDEEENDERYRALNDEYHASKYLESIGVTPTARRCKMMIRLQHRQYGTPPRDGIEEGQGNNISSRRDSTNIPQQQHPSHTDTSSSSSSSSAAAAAAEAVVSLLLDKEGLPPLVMSDASPLPILLPNIPLHGFNGGEASGGAPQEDSIKDGNKLNEVPVDRTIIHELENLRHQQRQEQARHPPGKDMIQTTGAVMGCDDDDMNGSIDRLHTAGNDGNDNDDDAQFCRLTRRFVWPFAYLDYESSSSSSSHHRSIRQEYVWGGFESSSGMSMEREIDSTLLKGIVRQKRISITIPQVEDYMTHYITNTYPIPLLRGDIPTRRRLVSGVGDDGHLPPRLVEQFHRLCKECIGTHDTASMVSSAVQPAEDLQCQGSPTAAGLLAPTMYPVTQGMCEVGKVNVRINAMFKVLFDPDMTLSRFPHLERPSAGMIDKDLIRMAREADAKATAASSTLPPDCRGKRQGKSRQIPTSRLSTAAPPPAAHGNTALLRVSMTPETCSHPRVRRYLTRQQESATTKHAFLHDWLQGRRAGKKRPAGFKPIRVKPSTTTTADTPSADTMIRTHLKAAEAETRPCSTSPSREDRHRVRTRSELTEADDSGIIFNSNGADEQEDSMNTAGSPLQASDDSMMIQPGQPLGKRPRLSKSPLHSKAIGTASSSLVAHADDDGASIWKGFRKMEESVIGAHPQPDRAPSNDALSLRDEGRHGDRATSDRSSECDNEHELLTSPAVLTFYSGNMSSERSPSRDVKIAKNINGERKSGDRRLPAPEVCLLPTTAEGCPMTEDACIAGLWKSIGWEVELHYDCESGKVWGRWGPLQAITAYLSGDRLVDGILELGGIQLTEAVVDLQGGTIHWGTGEVDQASRGMSKRI